MVKVRHLDETVWRIPYQLSLGSHCKLTTLGENVHINSTQLFQAFKSPVICVKVLNCFYLYDIRCVLFTFLHCVPPNDGLPLLSRGAESNVKCLRFGRQVAVWHAWRWRSWLFQSQRCFHRSSPVCFTPAASWFFTLLLCRWDKVNAWFKAVTPTQAPKVTFYCVGVEGERGGWGGGGIWGPREPIWKWSTAPSQHHQQSAAAFFSCCRLEQEIWKKSFDKSWLNTHTARHVRVILFTNDKKKTTTTRTTTTPDHKKYILLSHIYISMYFWGSNEGKIKKKKKKETSSHGWSGWVVFSG